MLTQNYKVLLRWIWLELVIGMSEFVDTVGKISSSCNGRDVCEAPEGSQGSESLGSWFRGNISVCATKSLLCMTLRNDLGTRPGQALGRGSK